MDSTVRQLWQDVVQCHLLTADESRALVKKQKESNAEPSSARQLAKMLVADRLITPYHAKSLLAGHAGPFLFGDYRVNERLPGGGHTRRFSGIHVPTKHKVLLHFCSNPDEITDEEWAAESNYLDRHRAIVDPHLDRCYETITRTKHKIAITEHVKGEVVADVLQENTRLSIPLACDIIRQAAAGVQSLSQAGLVHGLIQPDRLVVQKTGQVRVLRDPTTIPKPIDLSTPDPKGYLAQRANYFAPELMTPDRNHDTRTDIYALGCTLFELLIGRPPFDGGSIHEKMVRHSQEPIISLTDAIGAPPELADTVAFMMAKNYNVRFESPQQIIDALAPFCGEAPTNRTAQFRSTEIRYCEDLRMRLQTVTKKEEPAAAPTPSQAQSAPSAPATPPTNHANAPKTHLAQSRKSGPIWIKIACGLAAIAAIGTVAFVLHHLVTNPTVSRRDTTSPGEHASSAASVTPPPVETTETPNDSLNAVQASAGIAEDDGESLWQSPTGGGPVDLAFLPTGVQFFGSVNMRDLLTSFEGRRVLQALGPEFQTWRKTWQAETNISFDQIDTLVFASIGESIDNPKSMFVVHLISREPIDELIQRNRTSGAASGRTWQVGKRAFLAASDQPILAVGDPALIASVGKSGGSPPLLRRDLEILRTASDVSRHFNIIATANFLSADGKLIIPERRRRARVGLLGLLGDEARAGLASLHFSDRAFYGELRIVGPTDANPHHLSQQFENRLAAIPAAVTSFLGAATVDPYWQRLALQIPMMTRFLIDHSRVVPDSDQAIANFALPPQAGHNLVLAGEIVSGLSPKRSPSTKPAEVRSIDSILAHSMTYEFAQESLENAVHNVTKMVNETLPGANLTVTIVGGDLLLDGITRNQQIANFSQSQASVSTILTELLTMANPDPAATSSSHPKQKLVWVIDKDATSPTILVTTRGAAARKGHELPAAFRQQ